MSAVSCQLSLAAPGDIIDIFSIGGPIYASPTLSPNGTVYLGANDARCYAIYPLPDGLTAQWTYTADDWIDSSVAIGPDGTLYVTTYNSTLVALLPDTGIEKWSVKVGAEDNALGVIRSSPAIADDGTIIVTTNEGFAHAFNALGEQIWSFEMGSETRSSPAIGPDGQIYFGTANGLLYCLSGMGALQWSYAVDSAGTEASRIYSSPAIDRNGNVYFGSGNGFLYSVTAAGEYRWKYETSEAVDSSPAIDAENQVYFASRNGTVYCVDQSGALVWSNFLGDIFYSSPVIDANGFLYATYFGGQGKSFVVALGPGGVEAWQTQINAIIDSSLTIATDGTLYVGAFDGNVYAIQGSGSPLGYQSAWPRFRKDARSRGRVIGGSLPTITTPLEAALVMEGNSAEFFVQATGSEMNDYHWRKDGVLIGGDQGSSLLLPSTSSDAIAVYDVIVSNDFGEILTPASFLSTYSAPAFEFSSNVFQFSTQISYPDSSALADVRVTHSTDLLNWSVDGVTLESESPRNGRANIKASITTDSNAGFLRLEVPSSR